jgi:hypothetical protein
LSLSVRFSFENVCIPWFVVLYVRPILAFLI